MKITPFGNRSLALSRIVAGGEAYRMIAMAECLGARRQLPTATTEVEELAGQNASTTGDAAAWLRPPTAMIR